MRLIDADALTEDIKECIKANEEECEWAWVEGMRAALSFVEDAPTISDLPSAQKWISCSERLPEDVETGDEYQYPTVIFSTDKAVYAGYYEYYLGGAWWCSDGDYKVDGVIAWMPLPPIYRGE